MSSTKPGKIIVICAPSGTGKSTLISKLHEDFPQLTWSISCTTRPMREGEKNGREYYFITKEEFHQRLARQEFIEWAQVHSNFYGTSRTFIDEGLKEGKIMLFDLDVQGCDSIRKIYGHEAIIIFIEPPSIEALEARLVKRATESKEVIQERVNNAKRELVRKNDFDYLVMNDDVENAYNKLSKIFNKIIN